MNTPNHPHFRAVARPAAALLAAAVFALAVLPAAAPAQIRRDIDILNTVIRYVKTDYLEVPDPNKSMAGAFEGLINALDTLSGYLDKGAAAKYAAARTSPLKDVGAIVFKRANAFPLIIGVVPGSPAEKAGIKMGDYLSALDDRSTLVWSLSQIVTDLKDTAALTVKLRIIRENTTKEIPVTRADVYPRALTYGPQAGTAGILTIHHFFLPLVSEMARTIVPQLKGAKSPVVIDLRDCHEGDPSVAAAFLNFFLSGDTAGGFQKKSGEMDVLACPNPAPLAGIPIVAWTNQATIGPAEIVAAALQDQRQAKVVGIVTPGLASEQELFPLGSGDALLLTTGVYVTAAGRKIWGAGITPDTAVEAGKTATKDYLAKTAAFFSAR